MATQMADSRPQIDTPLRIMLPENIPQRNGRQIRDDVIRQAAFSPDAYAQSLLAEIPEKGKEVSERTPTASALMAMAHDADIHTKIKDFSTLAFSSRRAGKLDVEGQAYLSLAVIYDNQRNYKLGIENYQLYMDICTQLQDDQGKCLALNCIGVNYMLMAKEPLKKTGKAVAADASARQAGYLQESINAHSDMLKIGDAGAVFLAHTNIGLAYYVLGVTSKAARHHQDALRSAIKMQSLYGQGIALGNLGLIAMRKFDYPTARTCLEQHAQLIQALQDSEAEVHAWKVLAQVLALQGGYEDAIDALAQVRIIASDNAYTSELRRILCLLGQAKSELMFDSYYGEMMDSASTGPPPVSLP